MAARIKGRVSDGAGSGKAGRGLGPPPPGASRTAYTPWASMASATLVKPAMLAPIT